MLGAGRRDRKVVFQREVTIEDEYGEPIGRSWQPVAASWATVSYGSGAERRQAAAEGGSQGLTVRVLATTATRSVLLTDRALLDAKLVDDEWTGEALDIVGVSPIGRTEIEFTAVRVVR